MYISNSDFNYYINLININVMTKVNNNVCDYILKIEFSADNRVTYYIYII